MALSLKLDESFTLSADEKSLMLRQSPLIISAGVLLCFHYGAWVESIQSTSLAHAVLLVSTSPIFIALGTWILRKPISYGRNSGQSSSCLIGLVLGGVSRPTFANVQKSASPVTWCLNPSTCKVLRAGELIGTAVAVVGLGIMTATSGAAGSEREASSSHAELV